MVGFSERKAANQNAQPNASLTVKLKVAQVARVAPKTLTSLKLGVVKALAADIDLVTPHFAHFNRIDHVTRSSVKHERFIRTG